MLLGSINKQPAEVIDYDVTYERFLKGSTDTLASANVDVTPSGLSASPTVGDRVKLWLSGGTHLTTYKVTVTTTTQDGRVKQDEIKVKVKDI